MARTIPLIRAAALVPMIRWMHANGRPLEQRLSDVDLGYMPLREPNSPVPVYAAAAFFRDAARREGPDIGCRVVASTSVMELAMIGKVALGARTPREAMTRAIGALPFHCTHETISIIDLPNGTILREAWLTPLDHETLHVIQQFVVAILMTLCRMTGHQGPIFERVEMMPHPVHGLDHLRSWSGTQVVAAESEALSITVDPAVFDRRFRVVARDRMTGPPPPEWAKLRGDGTLSASVRTVMKAMLETGAPTVERLTAVSGMSLRSFQRHLGHEGTSFSALLEEVRRELALQRLGSRKGALGVLASELGYSGQATLTRAMRRWTGKTPTGVSAKSAN